MHWECMWDLLLVFCLCFFLFFFAIVIKVFTDFFNAKRSHLQADMTRYMLYVVVLQDWKMSVLWEDQIVYYFHPEEFSCFQLSILPDTITKAESIPHGLGLMPHYTLCMLNNTLKMWGITLTVVLLLCDGLVILMWPTDKSHTVQTVICISPETLCITEGNEWGIRLRNTVSPSFPSEALYHCSGDAHSSCVDFFKKLFCILDIVSMVTV